MDKQETKGEDTREISLIQVEVDELRGLVTVAQMLAGYGHSGKRLSPYEEDSCKEVVTYWQGVLAQVESSSKGHAELPAFPIEKLQARLAEEANKAMRAEELGRYFGLNDVRDWIKELEAEENIGGGGKDA